MTMYEYTVVVFIGAFAFAPALLSLAGVRPAFRFWTHLSWFTIYYTLGYVFYLAGVLK